MAPATELDLNEHEALIKSLLEGSYSRSDMREFADHLLSLGRSPRTVSAYVHAVRRIERAANKPIQDVGSLDLVKFRSNGCSVSTIEQTIVATRAFHVFGAERGYWSLNGIMAVRTPKRDRNPSDWLPLSTIEILLRAAERHPLGLRLCLLGLYAGCRISESAAMDHEHHLGDRLRFEGKGSKWREVPLHPVLEARIAEIFRLPPVTDQQLHRARRALTRRTGISFHPHQFRASFAHVLEEANVDHDIRAALLGHAATLTMGYSGGVSWHRKVDAISRLSYQLPT